MKLSPRPALFLSATLASLAAVAGCKDHDRPGRGGSEDLPYPENPGAGVASAPAASSASAVRERRFGAMDRARFNQLAVRLNLPLYWTADRNKNGAVDPDEVASLLFYPTEGRWVDKGKFTPAFEAAYERLAKEGDAPIAAGPDLERRKLVREELDAAMATLVYSDFRAATSEDKALVGHMLKVAHLIDDLHATLNGAKALVGQVPADDLASQSAFRRNWGPKCLTPSMEKQPACSSIPGAPAPVFDIYPAQLQQKGPGFCEGIEKNPASKKLTNPFVVVREKEAGKLVPVSYVEAYREPMNQIAAELRAAEAGVTDPKEAPLKSYLAAAASSFQSNDWSGADEAWSKMSVQNSAWYVRVAPDEVYWEPCSQKAGFHLTFARINKDSLRWQQKLLPVQQDMETSMGELIGAPYKARKVTFHLPDFIDIVVNAGDDRAPLGATIGQSLPNWGAIVAAGRGRTVAMSNLYADPDSMQIRRKKAESWLVRDSVAPYVDEPEPGLVATILHEATHNLGPAHSYEYKGKIDAAAFGGDLSSMLEELKAQSGALYYVDFAAKRGILTPQLAKQVYVDCVVWALNHLAKGMWTDTHHRKPYSQLAAIQIGFLLDEKALRFDPSAQAANGTDKGALAIDFDKLPAAIDKLMKVVGGIKATNDKAGAEALAARYVDGAVVPHKLISERALRYPQTNFVYALDL